MTRHPKPMAAAVLAACALAGLPGAAHGAEPGAPVPTEVPRIAEGVRVAGLNVGGLTVEQASRRIELRRTSWVRRAVVVRVGGRDHRMPGSRALVRLDAGATARRALEAGEELSRRTGGTSRGAASPTVEVDLVVRHSRNRVRRFARGVARRVDRRPRSARVRVGITRVTLRRARHGARLDQERLSRRVDARFSNPRLRRRLNERAARVRPSVTTGEMRRRYRTVVTVDRHNFRLRLFRNFRVVRSYSIALGKDGHSTPAGLFSITSKQVNPAWHAPNRPWAGQYAGRTIPGGHPENPLKARWLGIRDGVGIHGTSAEWSIGTRASHGCIRMRVSEVIDLYDRVPLGTPIRISR